MYQILRSSQRKTIFSGIKVWTYVSYQKIFFWQKQKKQNNNGNKYEMGQAMGWHFSIKIVKRWTISVIVSRVSLWQYSSWFKSKIHHRRGFSTYEKWKRCRRQKPQAPTMIVPVKTSVSFVIVDVPVKLYRPFLSILIPDNQKEKTIFFSATWSYFGLAISQIGFVMGMTVFCWMLLR